MQTAHTLKSLEEVITVSLNPFKNNVNKLSELEIKLLEKRLQEEFEKLQFSLLNQVFETSDEIRIRLIVNFYHDELITLVNDVYKRRHFFPVSNKVLHHAYEFMISALDEVISLIELRFSDYIGLVKKAPVTYLIATKDELRKKMESLKKGLQEKIPDQRYIKPVLDAIDQFTDAPLEHAPATFKEVLYMKELVRQLEFFDKPENPGSACTALTKLLVSLNFNNKGFISYLTDNVMAGIKGFTSPEEQYQQLAFKRKEFSQLYETPGIGYDLQLPGIKRQIDSWFSQEMFFLEQAMKLPQWHPKEQKETVFSKKLESIKLHVMLSGDQIGLLLRGLEQNRVILAPTKKAVFEAIVPFLSSKERSELSPGNTRAKSYDATDHDKQVTVEMLEKLVKTISEF